MTNVEEIFGILDVRLNLEDSSVVCSFRRNPSKRCATFYSPKDVLEGLNELDIPRINGDVFMIYFIERESTYRKAMEIVRNYNGRLNES